MAQQATTATANGPIWGGADNGADTTTTARRALYLKLFSGEMFKGFQRNTIARDLVTRSLAIVLRWKPLNISPENSFK